MGDLSQHFSRKEFACPHCKLAPMDLGLIRGLEALRAAAAKQLGKEVAVFISSGYRCVEHNRAEGGARNSMHVAGKAADIQVDQLTAYQVLKLCESIAEFTGIGFYVEEHFVHVDTRPLDAAVPTRRATWGRVERDGPYVSLELAKKAWKEKYR